MTSPSSLQKKNRTVHRWSGPPFVIAAILSLVYTAVGGDEKSVLFLLLGVILVASLLTLVVTGSVMWIRHYGRSPSPAAVPQR
jgi:hypothetical protein